MTAAPITVNVIADSITDGGDRLTTYEWTYPRMIHSEVLTHGMLRRNSASSRAIPAAKLRERVVNATERAQRRTERLSVVEPSDRQGWVWCNRAWHGVTLS